MIRAEIFVQISELFDFEQKLIDRIIGKELNRTDRNKKVSNSKNFYHYFDQRKQFFLRRKIYWDLNTFEKFSSGEENKKYFYDDN